jgi:putative hydrolase of the HAD superfamily
VTIRAAIFDWGGTLSEHAQVDMADMWALAARHLAPQDPDPLLQVMIEVEADSWTRVVTDQRSTRLADLLAEAARRTGLDVTEAILEEAATHHLDSWTPHIKHHPDAAPALVALRERGLRIGLLSNTHWPRHFHEHFLERDGLDELIDLRCYTSEMDHTKPHPNAFRAVLKGLGVKAHEAVFVGDRAFDDIYGAASMGMRTVLRFNPDVPGYDIVPDAVIGSLAELVDLVDEWR